MAAKGAANKAAVSGPAKTAVSGAAKTAVSGAAKAAVSGPAKTAVSGAAKGAASGTGKTAKAAAKAAASGAAKAAASGAAKAAKGAANKAVPSGAAKTAKAAAKTAKATAKTAASGTAKAPKDEAARIPTKTPAKTPTEAPTKAPKAADVAGRGPWELPTAPEAALAWLLPGYGATFRAEHWERAPLLVPAASDAARTRFQSLLDRRTVEAMLAKDEHFARNVMVCRADAAGRRDDGTPEQASAALLWRRYREGYTLQVFQPQQHSPAVAAVCRALEELFGCLVGSNSYLTPPHAQGLPPHHDDVDVFVLQLEGTKKWRLHAPSLSLPREHSGDLDPAQLGPLLMEATMGPGDVLYMPRGTVHYAVTDTTASHHLTVSTYQRTAWYDFVNEHIRNALQQAFVRDQRYRDGLPWNYAAYMGSGTAAALPAQPSTVLADRASFVQRATELVADLARFADADATADALAMDFVLHRLPPAPVGGEGGADGHAGPVKLLASTLVRLRHPGYVRLLVSEDGAAVFYATKNSVGRHMEPRAAPDSDESEDSDSDSDHEHAHSHGAHGHANGACCGAEDDDESLPCLQFDQGWAPMLATVIAAPTSGVRLDRLPRPPGADLTAVATVVRGLLAADLVALGP